MVFIIPSVAQAQLAWMQSTGRACGALTKKGESCYVSIAPTIAGYMFETISYSMPFLSGAFFIALNGVLYRTYFVSKNEV